MTSDAISGRHGAAPRAHGVVQHVQPTEPGVSTAEGRRWRRGRFVRALRRFTTITFDQITAADIDLTAEDIREQLNYGRD